MNASFLKSFASSAAVAQGPDGLLDGERASNKMLIALRQVPELRELLLLVAATASMDGHELYLLLPQSVTLYDVRVTKELIETHLVYLKCSSNRGEPRPFTSLNGLCGTCLADGAITVHGRLPEPSSVGGWAQSRGRMNSVPQLESQIVVLREATLPPSARLPLQAPVGLLLISDPIFFPGCGWKLPLALRRCTHRFTSVELNALPLADLPQVSPKRSFASLPRCSSSPLL